MDDLDGKFDDIDSVPIDMLIKLARYYGLRLRAGGEQLIEKALGMEIADVSDNRLMLLAGVGGVANTMKLLGVKSLVDVVDLDAKLFEQSTWWKHYQLLVAYKKDHNGDICVPQQHTTKEGLQEGSQ